MASSWTSKAPLPGVSPDVVRELRHRGWRGGWISPHRAFAYLPITITDAFTCATLVFSLTLGWVHMLKYVSRFWEWIFRYWNHALGLDATVFSATEHWGSFYFSLPYLNLPAGPPDPHTWWITGASTLGVLAIHCARLHSAKVHPVHAASLFCLWTVSRCADLCGPVFMGHELEVQPAAQDLIRKLRPYTAPCRRRRPLRMLPAPRPLLLTVFLPRQSTAWK